MSVTIISYAIRLFKRARGINEREDVTSAIQECRWGHNRKITVWIIGLIILFGNCARWRIYRSFSARVPGYRGQRSYRATRSRNKGYICRINMLFQDNMSCPSHTLQREHCRYGVKWYAARRSVATSFPVATPKESTLHTNTRQFVIFCFRRYRGNKGA